MNNMDDLEMFNHFSLDMVSTDMNFEQVYSMYNHLQQENALNAVEKLQKMQHLSALEQQEPRTEFDYHRSKILNMSLQEPEPESQVEPEADAISSSSSEDEEGDEEFDKFFSNTESNALDKFLDSLANPVNSNPLEMYHSEFTFKPKDKFKTDLTNAFAHPPQNSLFNNEERINTQLPTPESRQSSIDEELDLKRPLLDENDESRKKKKPSTKPLLSLEQKRLNHSHSEQKRRQLCKLAYERCLRLITNFETYAKQLPANKKSKRKQFTKDGLPNLSKHCALTRISNEIIKIRDKNDDLKNLLNVNGVI